MGTTLGCELGNQDGRLGQQTYQHDDTRLQVDVVVHARQTQLVAKEGEHESTHQAERHAEQHGPRSEPRVVKRGQDEVNENGADDIDESRGVRAGSLLQFARHATILEGSRVGHRLLEHLGNGFVGVTLSVAATSRDVATDVLEQVEVFDIGRTDNLLQTDELSDRCHLAALHLYEDVL